SAIQNLADNAAKYTEHGSVDVHADASGGRLEVHLRDTCPGLSRAELATIFEPFQRGETRPAGTGLGLSIARRAAEPQGGPFAAGSPGPQGCLFWSRLPSRVRASRRASGNGTRAPSSRPRRQSPPRPAGPERTPEARANRARAARAQARAQTARR